MAGADTLTSVNLKTEIEISFVLIKIFQGEVLKEVAVMAASSTAQSTVQFGANSAMWCAVHADPGTLKNMQNSITLKFMQWYDSIRLRMTEN